MTAKTANSLKALNVGNSDVAKTDLFKISPHLLVEEDGFNTRGLYCNDYWERPEVKERLMSLAEAYKRGDYIPPIVVKVKDGQALIRDGHRRNRALKIAINELGADIRKIEVLEHKGDEATQTLLIATSNDGAPLSVLERAEVYCRLSAWGWSDAEIASRTGRTPEHVRQLRKHMELPMEIKMLIQQDVVAATYAQELFDEHGTFAVKMIKDVAASVNKGANETGSDTISKPKRVTKKAVAQSAFESAKKPRLDKKTTIALSQGFRRLTSHLDQVKPSDDGSKYLLEIDRDELEMLQELREKLANIQLPDDASEADNMEIGDSKNQQALDLEESVA